MRFAVFIFLVVLARATAAPALIPPPSAPATRPANGPKIESITIAGETFRLEPPSMGVQNVLLQASDAPVLFWVAQYGSGTMAP